MTMGWPSPSLRRCWRMRAMTSVPPPGGYGTKKRTGFDGQSCAPATADASASPSSALRIVLVFCQQPCRLLQRVAAERVAKLARAHQLDDRRLAFFLRLAGAAQR